MRQRSVVKGGVNGIGEVASVIEISRNSAKDIAAREKFGYIDCTPAIKHVKEHRPFVFIT